MNRLALVTLAALLGCAGVRPEPRAQANLYRDLERLVRVAEAAGWNIDRYEIEELMPEALASVCRVPVAARRGLLSWIDAEIIDAGGPLEVAYRDRGEDLDEVKDLLGLTRVKLLLARAVVAAEADCPFWIDPEDNEPFAGRQILDDRWVLSFGGGGRGILIVTDGEVDLSAGGAGRLLFGRAFGPNWMISLGLEAGALATFPKEEDGDRSSLVLGAEVTTPLVFRYRLVESYIEFETGYLGQISENTDGLIHGVHTGVSVGAQSTRARWFLPGGAFGIAVERTFAKDPIPAVWAVKAGFRVAIDLAL